MQSSDVEAKWSKIGEDFRRSRKEVEYEPREKSQPVGTALNSAGAGKTVSVQLAPPAQSPGPSIEIRWDVSRCEYEVLLRLGSIWVSRYITRHMLAGCRSVSERSDMLAGVLDEMSNVVRAEIFRAAAASSGFNSMMHSGNRNGL